MEMERERKNLETELDRFLSYARTRKWNKQVQTLNGLSIAKNPPLEVRTSSKENRFFKISINVPRLNNIEKASISLSVCFSDTYEPFVRKDILSGTLHKEIIPNTTPLTVTFTNLSVKATSLKFNEREFCIKITLKLNKTEHKIYSTSFYAYSHKNVLNRRKNIKIELVSPSEVELTKNERLHIVGQPFLNTPYLSVIFCLLQESSSTWTFLKATNLKLFSESVLFFKTPSLLKSFNLNSCLVVVSNDGRSFSNFLKVNFKSEKIENDFDDMSFSSLILDVDEYNLLPQKRSKM